MVALVPLFGDVRVGKALRLRWQEAILITEDAAADEQRRIYSALSEIKWFSSQGPQCFPASVGFYSSQAEVRRRDTTADALAAPHQPGCHP